MTELAKVTMVRSGQKLILIGCSVCEQAPQGLDFCQQMCMMEFLRQWDLNIQLKGAQ